MKMETTVLQTFNIPLALGLGYLFVIVLGLGFLGVVLMTFFVYFIFMIGLLIILALRYKKQIAGLYYGLGDNDYFISKK